MYSGHIGDIGDDTDEKDEVEKLILKIYNQLQN
jgi:hypothetical protein